MSTRMRLSMSLVGLLAALLLSGCAATTTPTEEVTSAVTEQATSTPVAALPTDTPTTRAEPGDQEAYPLATPEVVAPTAAYPDAQPETVPQRTVNWTPDGNIGSAEYAQEKSVGQFAVWWNNDAEHLYVAILAPTTGWVGIGLDPVNRMQGADYIIAAVIENEPVIWDAFGMAPVGPNHPEDTALGGTMDVVAFTATEEGGKTLVEFQIPLDSGDAYDKPLVPGETYPAIVAYSNGDAFTAPHAAYGTLEMTLYPINQ